MLTVGSLVFYAVGEHVYVFLMIASIAANYFLALGIAKYRGRNSGRLLLMLAVLIDFGGLFFFKYLVFLQEIYVH